LIKIVQHFDKNVIRALAYTTEIYCISNSNERGKMQKILLGNVAPKDINKMLEDKSNMFVTFEKEKE